MKLTSRELLAFMEQTAPEDWPTPRGYGYGKGTAGKRIKAWHVAVVREFLDRLEVAVLQGWTVPETVQGQSGK